MSTIAPIVVNCPSCNHEERLRVFESVNAERIPVQVDLIAKGDFELTECTSCGVSYQPEHRMLFSDFSKRVWIVMQPSTDRPHFTTLERGVELILQEQLASAAPSVADGIRGIRPRLVFGQSMLAEAVRCAHAGLDAALLECAKLVAMRDQLQKFISLGPVELCFERFNDDGELVHSVVDLSSGKKVETENLANDAIAKARAAQPELEDSFPALFSRPYISACRYLYGAAA